jgi:RNA polymerase sigma-70 factor (ECF subfamily)
MTSVRGHAPFSPGAIGAPYGDAAWIRRIRESDRVAFEALVRHYADPLCAFIYNNTRDAEVSKELVQDLFLWIWRHRHEWEIRGSLTTYLYRSARNRSISHLRHHRLEQRWHDEMARARGPLGDAARSRATDEDVTMSELSQAIDSAVASLPTRCREVFTLNRQHRLSYREVGETLGISVKTVEVHMGRALAALRQQLADWLP